MKNAYTDALNIGFWGFVLQALLIVFTDIDPELLLLMVSVWVLVVMFVLPWLAVCYTNGSLQLPAWVYRGPHR